MDRPRQKHGTGQAIEQHDNCRLNDQGQKYETGAWLFFLIGQQIRQSEDHRHQRRGEGRRRMQRHGSKAETAAISPAIQKAKSGAPILQIKPNETAISVGRIESSYMNA
jgi:hypothetical protein